MNLISILFIGRLMTFIIHLYLILPFIYTDMELSEQTLWILAIVLFFGLVLPQLFRRIQLPFATALILVGAILGPNGTNMVRPDNTMEIFGFLGATFHMLLAGFEAETLLIKRAGSKFWVLAVLNTTIPFITGVATVKLFGYKWETSLFMGAIFISSSIMMVFSTVKNLKIQATKLGKTLKSLVVVEDLSSAMVIFILFKYTTPHERFPLPILLGLLISSVIMLRMFLPEVISYFFDRFERLKEEHEAQLRLIIAVLFFVLILYSSLDVHPIIGAFLVGFILSEIPQSAQVKEKLNTIGYALFIPIYLFITGIMIDPAALLELTLENYLPIIIVAGALFSKILSGYVGAKLADFSSAEAMLVGISSSTKLTVTVSSALVALSIGLIDNELYSAVLMVSVITTILNPVLMSTLVKRKTKTHHG